MVPVQHQESQKQQQQPVQECQTVWQGVLEWIEKTKNPDDPKIVRHIPCQVSSTPEDPTLDLKVDSWPQKLIMQLMPKQLIASIGGFYLKYSKPVLFHPQNCEELESLTKVMTSGFAGCVHFLNMSPTSTCDLRVLILLYSSEKCAYLGFIPKDQIGFVDRLRCIVQQSKASQALMKQRQGSAEHPTVQHSVPTGLSGPTRRIRSARLLPSFSGLPQLTAVHRIGCASSQSKELAPAQLMQEHQTIWQGVLEWIEKTKNPNDPQKLTRNIPCHVSTFSKAGEADLKADLWPPKLIMQVMPKQLIGNVGGIYIKNSKSVLFHLHDCEALESLTAIMSSGFAGCVHFVSMSPTSECDIKVLILLYTTEKRAYVGFIPHDQATFVDRLRRVIQQSKSTQALITHGQVQDQQLLTVQQQQQESQQQQQSAGVVTQNDQALGGPGPEQSPFDDIEVARLCDEITSHMKIQQLQQTLEVDQQQEMQFKAHVEQEQQEQLRAQLQQMCLQQQGQMTPQVLQLQPQHGQELGQMQQEQKQHTEGPVDVQRDAQQPGPGGQPQQQPSYNDVSGSDILG